MTYAIISVGGKQYRVREGERLLVDRVALADGEMFSPTVLLVGGDGGADLSPADGVVTARVVGEQRGPKIRIAKLKKRTGYRRHTGFRSALTQIEIASIGTGKSTRTKKAAAEEAPAEERPKRSRAKAAPTGDEPTPRASSRSKKAEASETEEES